MEECIMNILITGGSGFLGRHIVQYAKEAGYNVFSPRSYELNLEKMDGISQYLKSLLEEVEKIDVIIHSAAYYGGIGICQEEPATIFHKNSQMAINIFKVAKDCGVKKIIPIGSACAYPGYLEGDLKEENFWDGKLHDTVEAYGITKKFQLVAQRAYYKQDGIESIHLILTNLYGPHDVFTEYRSHVVSALIKKFSDAKDKVTLWGDGTPVREFLYVKDAAEAVVKAIALEHDIQPVNIGTGVGTTIKELAESIKQFTRFEGVIEWDTTKPKGAMRKVLDITRMKTKLQWSPRYSLQDGLLETIDWYLKNKETADKRQ
jgi:nucleoside-diphosphate-sugar epimerase